VCLSREADTGQGSEKAEWNVSKQFVILDEQDEHTVRAVDTAEQIAAVKVEMSSLGIDKLPVFTGEAPDTVKTAFVIVA